MHEFGYYFAVFGSVIALGGLMSGKLIDMMGIRSLIGLGLSLMLMGGVSMLAWHLLAEMSLQGFLIPMAIACTGAMFVLGGAAAAALEPFGAIAGTAAAAFGTLDFGMSAIAGSILLLFPTTSTVPYGISIVLVSVLALGLFVAKGKLAEPQALAN